MIECLKFFIKHLGFLHNKTYKPSPIYNKNEDQANNEICNNKWWWKQQKNHLPQAIIISILISNNKTEINFSHEDEIL